MKKNLSIESFLYENDLIAFVNDNNISKEDILNIVVRGQSFFLFYYIDTDSEDESVSNESLDKVIEDLNSAMALLKDKFSK